PHLSTLSLHDALPIFGKASHVLSQRIIRWQHFFKLNSHALAKLKSPLKRQHTAPRHESRRTKNNQHNRKYGEQNKDNNNLCPQEDRKSTRLNSSHVKT